MEKEFIVVEPLKPLHRDDLPFGLAEEVVRKLQGEYPGAVIQFAGDSSDMPSEVTIGLRTQEEQVAHSLMFGACVNCDIRMLGYPVIGDDCNKDWRPALGWCHFVDMSDEIVGWQCPQCTGKENE